MIDIMEAKKATAETAVRESKGGQADFLRTTALLRAIGEISSDPIFAKDTAGRFIYANHATLAVIGKNSDIVLGHTVADWHSDPSQAANVMADDRRIMQTGIPEVIEETWDTPDRVTRTYRSTKAPLYYDDGTLIGIVCLSVDITSIKAADQKLEKVYNTAPVGLCFIDRDFRFVMVNNHLASINGLPVSAHIGRRLGDVLGNFGRMLEPFYQQVFDTGVSIIDKPISTEFSDDGLNRHWLLNLHPFDDEAGNIIGINATVREISEQKRAEEALVRANRMLHARSLTNLALVKATDEFSYLQTACQIVVDACGHTMMWIGRADHGNERRVEPIAAYGVDAGYLDVANITWADVERGQGPTGTAIRTGQPNISQDTSEDTRMAPWRSEAMKRGFRSSLALPLIAGSDKLGALTIYASVPNAFPEDEVKVLADIANDIAFGVSFLRLRESKSRVALSLRETKTKLSFFIEHAPAALAMLDNDMRYIFVSRRWLTDYRLEQSNIIGKSHYEIFPEVPDRWKDIHRRCLTGAVEKCDEDAFVRVDGRTDWVKWEIHPWHTDEGAIGGIVIMSEYITEQVEFRHLIEKSRRQAEAANDAKTRFLASVSHDLRQPLQAQRFLLFNVARYADKPDQVNACTQMEKTLEATELMLSRLMDFASLESGNVSVQKERFRLDQLVWDIIQQSDEEAAAKGLAIGARLQPCWTDSDPILLGRIVRNLITNALRYTERGGILVGIRRRGANLRLEIFDTGKGIPPDQQQVIFEEFRQLDNPERNRTKGHGLGLAIVAKTAELLGHQLFLRSVVGRGSVFAIEVPKVNGLDQPTLPVISQPIHVSGAISILVIEDDKMQAEALMSIFTGCGYSVFVAHDADAAMTAQIPSPDIIISDYRLPGNMTGVDTVASIRQLHARPIPAIIATGDTEAKIAIEAARADCDILIKPFTPAALMLAIAKKLGSDNRVVDGSENAPIAPLG